MNDSLSLLPTVCQYVILVSGVLVLAGGVIGFLKAGSKASLIAGGLSGALCIGAYAYTYADMLVGVIAAFVIFSALTAMFTARLKKTKKFMPSGLMLMVCGLAEVITLLTMLKLLEVF